MIPASRKNIRAISVGVAMLIIFYRNFYTEEKNQTGSEETEVIIEEESVTAKPAVAEK